MGHGLTGQVIVLPSEDHTAYETHTRRLFDDLQPKGALEEQFVQSLADTWRLSRVAALETNLLALGIHEQSHNVDTAHPEVQTALAMAASVREQIRAREPQQSRASTFPPIRADAPTTPRNSVRTP